MIKMFALSLLLFVMPLVAEEVKTEKEICQDPSKLDASMRKAYEDLQSIAKDIEGMKVEIRCYKRKVSKN